MPDPVVTWDRPMLERFKRELRKHTLPDGIFTFEGHEYLVAYARYLVEYLETRLAQ